MAIRALLSRILTGQDAAVRPPTRTELEGTFGRRWLAPALLIFATPLLVVLLWMICARYDGSIARFVRLADAATIAFPRPSWWALGVIASWVGLPGHTAGGSAWQDAPRAGHADRAAAAVQLNGVAAWVITHTGLAIGWVRGSGLQRWSTASSVRS